MKQIKSEIKDLIWNKVSEKAYHEINSTTWNKIWDNIRPQFDRQVYHQTKNQIVQNYEKNQDGKLNPG